MEITLDRQAFPQNCQECGIDFLVVRGSAYDAGTPFGLYLVALHGHASQGRLAHLAVAVLDRLNPDRPPRAVAMHVIGMPEHLAFSAVDWCLSPWREEAYLGEMLDREQALADPSWPTFLHVATHVVQDLPEAKSYFT